MGSTQFRGPRRLVGSLIAATLIGTVLSTLVVTDAEARRRRPQRDTYRPPYSEIAVDAKTGRVIEATNADSPRHPASLTKIMTLYLLFERIERGQLNMRSELTVSSNAADQDPSKLGLRPGSRISVEDAIRALVTKSANDVAVTVAENLAGSEERFAEQMTRKARILGMHNTRYYNASGLPEPRQITTARDQVLLGRAIQDRFPKLYGYFSTHTFVYRGNAYRNHNRLLGNVEGVDGIKTGYVRASGFNLVTSVRRNGRHIVAAVLGGPSSRIRDARMRELIAETLPVASAGPRTVAMITDSDAVVADDSLTTAGLPVRSREIVAQAPVQTRPVPKVDMVQPGTQPVLAYAPPPPAPRGGILGAIPAGHMTIGSPAAPIPVVRQAPRPQQAEVPQAPTQLVDARVEAPVATAAPISITPPVAEVAPSEPPQRVASLAPVPATQPRVEIAPQRTAATPVPAKPAAREGEWQIQIGAFPEEAKAKLMLREMQTKLRTVLGGHEIYTERVSKGSAELFRARFAGFDHRDQAEAACRAVKKAGSACIAVRN